jgi:methionyl-tRNA formyltransferase
VSAAPLRIVVAAEEAAGVQVLRLLAASPHRVVSVLTAGLGDAAARLGYVARAPTLVKDPAFATTLAAEGVDLLLNIHSLCIAHRAVVVAPRLGSFNLHPGPLPGYAGLNAPSWAIYHGERAHAVTLHWMNAGVDTGDIVAAAPVPITPDDTGYTLSARCVRAGLPLVAALLEAAARAPGAIPRAPQPAGVRRYFGREVPNGGRVAWSEPAQRVVDFVRAADYLPFSSPWGHPRARIPGDRGGERGERDVQLVKVQRTGLATGGAPAGIVGGRVGTDVLVAAADEWVRVRRVRIEGRDVAPAAVMQAGACLAGRE